MSPPLRPRALATLGSRTYLPVGQEGPYSVACADVANKDVMLRIFYPHKRHLSEDEKITYVKSQSKRWAKWFPLSPHYANGYLGFKYSRELPNFLGKVFEWLSHDPYCPVIQNGALAHPEAGQRFPMVVFSHGNGGCRTTYSMLCYEMASQGRVVAAIEHTDGSAACAARLASSGGGVEWVHKRVMPGNEEEDIVIREDQVSIRGRECHSALKVLHDLSEAKTEHLSRPWLKDGDMDDLSLASFGGKLRKDGAVVCGHSFGGASVLKALHEDENNAFSAGVLFDGWLYPVKRQLAEMSQKLSRVPLLFLNYEKFQWKENLWHMSRFAPAPVWTIRDAVHYVATDLPVIMHGSYVSSVLGLMERIFSPGTPRAVTADSEQSLTPELGLSLNLRLFTSFLESEAGLGLEPRPTEKSFPDLLGDYSMHLIEGTSYMGEEEKPKGDADQSKL